MARTYDAEIRRTTHGVAHIRAATVPDVCFGQGYACAADHLPTIADQILKVRSERARFLGRGEGDRHVNSDLGYLALDVAGWAERMAATQPSEIVEIVEAYAAGINRWLADHGTASLPDWCRDAAWVRPVSALDLFGCTPTPRSWHLGATSHSSSGRPVHRARRTTRRTPPDR